MEDKQVVNVPSGKNIEIVIRVFDNPSSAVVVNDDSELKDKLKEAEDRAWAAKEEMQALEFKTISVQSELTALKSRAAAIEDEKISLQSKLKAAESDKKFFVDKVQTIETEKNSLQRKFESVRRLVELHEQYKNLSEHIRAEFDGLIFDQSPVTFTMSLASVDRLKRFYRKLESAVANSADEIESSMAFPDHLKTLAAVFDFFFNNYINGTSNINCSRQHIAVGSAFDEIHCYRVGRRIGKVKEVLIQGFTIDGKSEAKSIVLVEDY